MSGRVVRRRTDVSSRSPGSRCSSCAVIASDGTVGPVELAVFHAINGLPEALSPVMQWVQWLGVLAVGPIVALGAALFRRWRLAIACLLVTVEKLVFERIVWQLVERSRPGKTIADAIVRGDTPMAGASFVSGHVVLLTGSRGCSRTYAVAGAWSRGRSSRWSRSPVSTPGPTRRSTCSAVSVSDSWWGAPRTSSWDGPADEAGEDVVSSGAWCSEPGPGSREGVVSSRVRRDGRSTARARTSHAGGGR